MKKKKSAGGQKKYTHIKKAERLEISILLRKKYSFGDIARTLERSKSSISDEVAKNSVNRVYDPYKANAKARTRRKRSKYQGMRVMEYDDLEKYVEGKIKEDWSPEAIAGRLKKVDTHIKYAGKGAIYKYIYSVHGQRLEQCLYHNAVHKKSGSKKKKGERLIDRIFIDERPKYIENKEQFGDWEGDFIVSGKNGKGALLVLYERKAKYVLIRKLLSRGTEMVNRAIYETTGGIACFNSLTLDNDISFKKHKELSGLLKTPIYFCHPYHSWEKGGIENMNKLIRRYIPKKTDISQLNDEFIKMIEYKFNNRPRKCLDFKTPCEIMLENNQLEHEMFFKTHYNIFKTKSALSEASLVKVKRSA